VSTVLALLPLPAYAVGDPMVDGARLCTQQFLIQERANGIPNHLLAAISSTESGRWHNELGLALPWPWTINVEGKGYYFKNKAEAVAQTRALMNKGARSIDVGCMQVSLLHHPKAFANLEAAFDPKTNVAYAATFLRRNYDDLGDWVKATAAYHSRTPHYGQRYLGLIEKNWNRIVGKIQQARASQGLGAIPVVQPKFSSTRLPGATTARNPYVRTAQPSRSSATYTKTSQAKSMRIIQVSERAAPKHDVLVIRASTNPVVLADVGNNAAANATPKPAGTPASVDRAAAENNKNTRFVFSN
jgi:hypothetical protein